MEKKTSQLKIGVFSMLALVVLGLAILLTWAKTTDSVPTSTQPAEGGAAKETRLSILCVGDIMSHNPQTNAQYDSSKKAYNYDNNFQFVKPYIEAADLALCNVETTFSGKPYSGFPYFSAPDAIATALKNAGFDVAITANNHMADKGLEGMLRTLNVLEKNGLPAVGSVKEKSEARYLIQEVKGIKVGIVAFTYETGSGEGVTSLNGSVVSDEVADRINSFNFHTLEEDSARIKETVDQARAAGAQVIVAYYHWGEEYQKSANAYQKELAQMTADMGADVIFASHPHVLQETAWLETKDSGKKVPVFYSMGNFLSNQRTETLNNRYTEQGVLAQVELTYEQGGGISEISMSAVPTWLDKYDSGGKQVYAIVPLDKKMEENKALAASGHLSRAKQAKEDADGILGINH